MARRRISANQGLTGEPPRDGPRNLCESWGYTAYRTSFAQPGGTQMIVRSVVLAVIIGLTAHQRCQAVTMTAYGPTAGGARGITTGPDGNLWFADEGARKIGKITPLGVITEYGPTDGHPYGITLGPDGNLWFTDDVGTTLSSAGKIGKITTAGIITEYGPSFDDGHTYTPNIDSLYGSAIVVGPDGNLWFTEHGRIGKISTTGVIRESDPLLGVPASPYGITLGPDGTLWFTDYRDLSMIGHITTDGVITEYGPVVGSLYDTAIAAGPDGNLWFTNSGSSRIGRISLQGVIVDYGPVAGIPRGIATGPDGNLWFTDQGGLNGGQIGTITNAGVITEYLRPEPSNPFSSPWGITTGPDGNVWFTDPDSKLIGRITPDTTTQTTSTTTTTIAGGGCSTILACEDGLRSTLPDPSGAASRKVKRSATSLRNLFKRVEGLLSRSALNSGGKQRRQYRLADKMLRTLLAMANRTSDAGTLGVPLPPLEAAVNALRFAIPQL